LISKKLEKETVFESSVLACSGSGLSKNAGSGSVLNQSGSTILNKRQKKYCKLQSRDIYSMKMK
jgi:hypothetical protein